MIYLLTAIGLSPGGSSTVHIYTQTIHRTTQNKQIFTEDRNIKFQENPSSGSRSDTHGQTDGNTSVR